MPEQRKFPLVIRNALCAEDVRPEANGKHSLLGVFAGDLLVQELVGAVRMAFYIEATTKVTGIIEANVIVYFDKQPIIKGEAKLDFLNVEDPAVFAIPSFPVMLTKEGELRVDIECNGATRTVLKKMVRKADLEAMARAREKSLKALTPPAPRRRRPRNL